MRRIDWSAILCCSWLCLAAAGCTSWPEPGGWSPFGNRQAEVEPETDPPQDEQQPPEKQPDPAADDRADKPADEQRVAAEPNQQPAPGEHINLLEGSRFSPGEARQVSHGAPRNITAQAPEARGVDVRSFGRVFAELEALGAIDEAERQRMLTELDATPPQLWPQLLRQYQAIADYHRRQQAVAAAGAGPGAFAGRPEAREPAANPYGPPQAARPEQEALSSRQAGPDGASLAASETPPGGMTDLRYPGDLNQQPGPQNSGYVAVGHQAQATGAPGGLQGRARPATYLAAGPPNAPPVQGQLVAAQQAPDGTRPAPEAVAALERRGETAAPPAEAQAVTETQSSRSEAASEPATETPAEEPKAWDEHLADAIRELEDQTEQPPETVAQIEKHVFLRVMYLMDGRRDEALEPIDALPPEQQEFWSEQLYALSVYLDEERTPDVRARAAEASEHLRDAVGRLAELGMLAVRNLAFCTEISSYGVVKKFDAYDFQPGQEVLLYTEVENFKSVRTSKGYHTSLASSYQIFDDDGERVAKDDLGTTEETCHNRRRDYFIGYRLRIPEELDAGSYTLKLTVEDENGNKTGESSIKFRLEK